MKFVKILGASIIIAILLVLFGGLAILFCIKDVYQSIENEILADGKRTISIRLQRWVEYISLAIVTLAINSGAWFLLLEKIL